ncbi:DJ-1/PfpI family protein [Sphingorhabdus sp. Alg231-15]|uniref:DJ-1/PfpI family protein n=1 Tax=Sphingorhabdus sp. Alg231-15 TaxID=1922222 RepID=UPI00307CBC02
MLIQSLIYPGFTTLDLIGALQPLTQIPGAKTEIVAGVAGVNPTDSGASIMADATFETASTAPDVILVPGGGTPSIDILEDQATMDFLARQGESAGWIVSVCTGALLLGKAGLLEGYKAATHWAVIDTLEAFGATPVHERVVIDRNRCTGGGVTAGVDIGLTVAGQLAGDDMGRVIELIIEYNPAPPFGTGHPTLADPKTLEMGKAGAEAVMQPDRIRQIAAA